MTGPFFNNGTKNVPFENCREKGTYCWKTEQSNGECSHSSTAVLNLGGVKTFQGKHENR